MELNIILKELEKLNWNDLDTVKRYADGLLDKKAGLNDRSMYSNEPVIGQTYKIGNSKCGIYEVKVLKNKRVKSVCIVVNFVSSGTMRRQFETGATINVPFEMFKK